MSLAGVPGQASMHIAIEGQSPAAGQGPGGASAGEFDRVLQSVMSADGASGAGAWQAPSIAPMGSLETVTVQKPDVAAPSNGVEASDLLREAQSGYDRLNQLIEGIRSGGTFSLQELMGMQLEAYKITMQLETTTKAIAEAVNNTKQLLQQQI